MSCRLFTHIYVYMLTMYKQQPQQHKERGNRGEEEQQTESVNRLANVNLVEPQEIENRQPHDKLRKVWKRNTKKK